jgi:hypothetical protein
MFVMRRRTLIAFALGVTLLVPLVLVADDAGVGSWGLTGIGVAVMLLMSLVDRDWFYGAEPRERR